MTINRFRFLYPLVAFFVVAMLCELACACPNCKEGIAAGGAANARNLARGFELSIYLMLGMPILIFSSLAGLFYWQLRRAAKNPELWLQAEGVQRP